MTTDMLSPQLEDARHLAARAQIYNKRIVEALKTAPDAGDLSTQEATAIVTAFALVAIAEALIEGNQIAKDKYKLDVGTRNDG